MIDHNGLYIDVPDCLGPDFDSSMIPLPPKLTMHGVRLVLATRSMVKSPMDPHRDRCGAAEWAENVQRKWKAKHVEPKHGHVNVDS